MDTPLSPKGEVLSTTPCPDFLGWSSGELLLYGVGSPSLTIIIKLYVKRLYSRVRHRRNLYQSLNTYLRTRQECCIFIYPCPAPPATHWIVLGPGYYR